MIFKHVTLENGLTILGEINCAAQSAAVGFFVKTGSRDEAGNVSGVSHFLEHMLFKGTEKLDAFGVSCAFDRLGAKFNAFTSEENTVYYAAVLPEYLTEVTELWIQLMKPALRDEDFDIEKNVILEEIAMYKDNPQFDVIDSAKSLHFENHPCGNSVLGTDQSITELTAEQMRDYFKNRYSADNMVVACCGKIDFDNLCRLLTDRCRDRQSSAAKRHITSCRGSLKKQQRHKSNLVREHICLIIPSIGAQDSRRFAAAMLSIILGDNSGSRLFWALVDTALAETAVSQHQAMDGSGALYTYVSCNPANSPKVLKVVNETLAALLSEPVSEKELQTAKNKVLSAVTIKSEQPMGRLVDVGLNWTYLEQYRSLADDIEAIKAVTGDQVNSLIKEFNPTSYTLFSLAPERPKTAI